MDTPDLKPKRKNDDKPKDPPSRGALVLGILALVLMIGIAFIIRPRFIPMSDVPQYDLVYEEQLNGIYALDFQTGQRSPITYPPKPSWAYSHEMSPDDRWVISFEWLYDEKISLLILRNVTGQENPRTLGRFGRSYYSTKVADWSPDQQWILFAADPLGSQAYMSPDNLNDSEIWMVHVRTGEIKRLTNNSYRDTNPAFSPDGTQIAYISAASGSQRIYLMDVVTGESRQLTPDSSAQTQALLWSPDGQWIAYNVTERVDVNATSLYNTENYYFNSYIDLIRVDGTHMQRVTGGNGISVMLDWKP